MFLNLLIVPLVALLWKYYLVVYKYLVSSVSNWYFYKDSCHRALLNNNIMCRRFNILVSSSNHSQMRGKIVISRKIWKEMYLWDLLLIIDIQDWIALDHGSIVTDRRNDTPVYPDADIKVIQQIYPVSRTSRKLRWKLARHLTLTEKVLFLKNRSFSSET